MSEKQPNQEHPNPHPPTQPHQSLSSQPQPQPQQSSSSPTSPSSPTSSPNPPNNTQPKSQQNQIQETTAQIQDELRNSNSGPIQTVQTAQTQLSGKIEEVVEEVLKMEGVKTQEISVQAGGNRGGEVLKNIQETYAPQSCSVFVPAQRKKSNTEAQQKIEQNADNEEGAGKQNNTQSQVQIQVGVSLLDQPQKVITKAKQQRILSDHQNFSKFLQTQKILSQNQKSVYLHLYESIQKKKLLIHDIYEMLKSHFTKYASIMKKFSQKSEHPVAEQVEVGQLNPYLNIGQEMKDGYAELKKFKVISGENFRVMYEAVQGKVLKELDLDYQKYVNQMANAQSLVNQKRKAYLKLEEQFQKQGSKVQKMFNRTKDGKKQQDDFFIQISKAIILQRQLRQALIQWGHQISNLRNQLISNNQKFCHEIQLIINSFKSQSNFLYGLQKSKPDPIRKTRQDIEQDTTISQLIILVDSDYIRSSIQASLKKEVGEITEDVFGKFVELPHFGVSMGDTKDLLKNMKVKVFNVKDSTQELVNTVSGNLVLYNKETLESTEKMSVKHIKGAITMQQGAIEIEQKVPGIIFDSKKKIRLEFKDPDRAQQLVCFLGQGETTNN